jgi:hypothetical protein
MQRSVYAASDWRALMPTVGTGQRESKDVWLRVPMTSEQVALVEREHKRLREVGVKMDELEPLSEFLTARNIESVYIPPPPPAAKILTNEQRFAELFPDEYINWDDIHRAVLGSNEVYRGEIPGLEILKRCILDLDSHNFDEIALTQYPTYEELFAYLIVRIQQSPHITVTLKLSLDAWLEPFRAPEHALEPMDF